MDSPVLLSLVKSFDECAALKRACLCVAESAEAAAPAAVCDEVPFVSTNDAVCGEVVAALGAPADAGAADAAGDSRFAMSMVFDFRPALGAEAVFGNMWTSLEFLVPPSLAAAAEIRGALAGVARDADFVRWNAAQGANYAWPAKLMMNTWTKAFALRDLAFAAPPEDVMLGRPMLEQRAAMMAPQGIAYCITLPQSDGGVKVVGLMPDAAAQRLGSSGRLTTVAVGS